MTASSSEQSLREFFINILQMGSERAIADLAIQAINKDQMRFEVVLSLCFREKYPLCMRAARVIQLYCEKDTSFLIPDLDNIINLSLGSKVEGVKRNFLKVFAEFIDFSLLSDSGLLLNKCFEMLMDASEKPGIRVHSMQLLCKYALIEKDIAKELLEVLDFLEEDQAPSFRCVKTRVLHKLRSQKIGVRN